MAVMCNQVECRLFKCGVNWPEYMSGNIRVKELYHVQKFPFSNYEIYNPVTLPKASFFKNIYLIAV